LPGECDLARRCVERLAAFDPLPWSQLEVTPDKRLVNPGAPVRCKQLEAVTGRTQHAVERVHRRIGRARLQLRDRGLRCAQSNGQLRLRQADTSTGIADERTSVYEYEFYLLYDMN